MKTKKLTVVICLGSELWCVCYVISCLTDEGERVWYTLFVLAQRFIQNFIVIDLVVHTLHCIVSGPQTTLQSAYMFIQCSGVVEGFEDLRLDYLHTCITQYGSTVYIGMALVWPAL